MRGIDYVVEECPNSVGATQLVYKDALNRLEAASPGTKLAFVREFLRTGQPAFAARADDQRPPQTCARCGMPSWGDVCAFCKLVRGGRDQARARRHRAGGVSAPRRRRRRGDRSALRDRDPVVLLDRKGRTYLRTLQRGRSHERPRRADSPATT